MKIYASRAALFAVVLFLAVETALFCFVDRPVSVFLRGLDHSHHAWIDVFRAYTDFGKSKWYLWPSGLGFFACVALARRRALVAEARQRCADVGNKLLFFFACVAVSGIVADIAKLILSRARPIELMQNLYGFAFFSLDSRWHSMPSGHTTTAFAVVGALVKLYPRGTPVWIAFGLALAVSRIMVNAHFMSDVLAGACVGWGTVYGLCLFGARARIAATTKRLFPIDSPDTPR